MYSAAMPLYIGRLDQLSLCVKVEVTGLVPVGVFLCAVFGSIRSEKEVGRDLDKKRLVSASSKRTKACAARGFSHVHHAVAGEELGACFYAAMNSGPIRRLDNCRMTPCRQCFEAIQSFAMVVAFMPAQPRRSTWRIRSGRAMRSFLCGSWVSTERCMEMSRQSTA